MMLAKSLQSAAGNAAGEANYIESVFQTHLYTGNGSTQTITNGIDLAGEGGLVWLKCRNSAENNEVYDTVRGPNQRLITNTTGVQVDRASSMAFSSTGLSWVGDNISNTNGNTYASWTFRKQPKFFDVVTFTGNSTSGRQISHSLGSAPGCIIVKNLTNADEWLVWHRSLGDFGGAGKNLVLNSTAAVDTGGYFGTAANQTSTYFTVNADTTKINWSGNTYVAYLFAHNAGGFGESGEDNVISCGSFTTDGSGNATVNLGYEPQWVLIKNATSGGTNWILADNMRGWTANGTVALLGPDRSNAEVSVANFVNLNATGFSAGANLGASATFIYIAIRRGPMKVPESGTSVYNAIAYTGNDAANRQITGLGFPPDLALVKARSQVRNYAWEDRLRGADKFLASSSADSEGSFSDFGAGGPFLQNGITVGANGLTNEAPTTYIFQGMRRAPGFFDVVCWTGNGASTRSVNHNLTVAPELLIAQNRTSGGNWFTYLPSGNVRMALNSSSASPVYGGAFAGTTPTATAFSFDVDLNTSGQNYVSYLFASCPGVSKVGSYTGNGSTQTINCGFTTGARFVLIKKTSGTGSWYVWDSARGIVSGNDPYLLLNSPAAEVTSTDYVDTYSAGFEISSTAPSEINENGGSFIFFAVA